MKKKLSILFSLIISLIMATGFTQPMPVSEYNQRDWLTPMRLVCGTMNEDFQISRIGAIEEPLNPLFFNQSSTTSKWAARMVFETLLVWNDAGYDFKPVLAEDWYLFDDGITIRMYLKEDVVFSNGNPFNADNIVSMKEYALDHQGSPMHRVWSKVNYIATEGNYTVYFTLHNPGQIEFLHLLALPAASIVFVLSEYDDSNSWTRYRGTGMHVICHIISGERIVFYPNSIANPSNIRCFDGCCLIERRKEIYIIHDRSFIEVMISAGYMDMFICDGMTNGITTNGFFPWPWPGRFPPGSIYIGGIWLLPYSNPINNPITINFNMQNDYLSNILVREAIAYGIDRQVFNDIFHGSINSAVSDAPWNFHSELYSGILREFDVDLARYRLVEAGHPAISLELILPQNEVYQVMAEIAGGSLAQVGIELSISILDQQTFNQRVQEGDFELALSTLNFASASAESVLESIIPLLHYEDGFLSYNLKQELNNLRMNICPLVRLEKTLGIQGNLANHLPMLNLGWGSNAAVWRTS